MTAAAAAGVLLLHGAPRAAEPAPKTVALEVPGAPAEFSEACRLFAESGVADAGAHSYAKALAALRNVARTAEDPAVRTRCLFLIALGEFLDGRTAQAARAGSDALSLAERTVPRDALVSAVAELADAAGKGVTDAQELTALLGLRENDAALPGELLALHAARAALDRKLEARWNKHKAGMYTRIEAWARAEGLSAKDQAYITERLEKRFRPKGFVDLTVVEDELVRMSLDLLVK